jgi:hypothetical protein
VRPHEDQVGSELLGSEDNALGREAVVDGDGLYRKTSGLHLDLGLVEQILGGFFLRLNEARDRITDITRASVVARPTTEAGSLTVTTVTSDLRALAMALA